MSNFVRARGVLAPFATGIAAAAFLIAGAAAPGLAQTSDQSKAPPKQRTATRAATSMRPASVDERIAQLHKDLKITAAEEGSWKGVADAMKENAQSMQSLIDQTKKEAPREKRNALEDLQTYQKFAQAHADGLQKLTAAFATLYNGMSPEQKANADRVFRAFEHRRPGREHS